MLGEALSNMYAARYSILNLLGLSAFLTPVRDVGLINLSGLISGLQQELSPSLSADESVAPR